MCVWSVPGRPQLRLTDVTERCLLTRRVFFFVGLMKVMMGRSVVFAFHATTMLLSLVLTTFYRRAVPSGHTEDR